jgi:hypothetical protein
MNVPPDLPQPPSINELIRLCLANRMDRCALVRREQGAVEVGVFVLVMGGKATRELGPGLLDFAEKAGALKPGEVLNMEYDTSLKWIWRWLEESKNRFAFGTFSMDVPLPGESGKVECLIVAFIGKTLCEPLARFLTKRGCPCSVK